MAEGIVMGEPRVPVWAITLAITVIALAISCAPARAASTRAEYVAQTDPICQSAERPIKKIGDAYLKASQEALMKFIEEISHGSKDQALRAIRHLQRSMLRFGHRFNRLQARLTAELALVPPPPGDEGIVGLWLQARGDGVRLSDRSLRAGKHGKLNKLVRLSGLAIAVFEQADRLVSDFGYQHCAAPAGTPVFAAAPQPQDIGS
jgi:hypothetical protein